MSKNTCSTKKKFFRKILLFALPVFVGGAYQLYLKQNGGFALWKTPTLSLDVDTLYLPSEKEIQEKSPSPEALHAILSQRFTFLGRGGQSFAFLGEDGETVLKIFKNYRYYTYDILHSLPFPSFLHDQIATGMKVRKFKRDRFYRGCVVAAYEIPEITQVSYIHLFPSKDLGIKLNLEDAMGFTHEVDADPLQFLLQKKLLVGDTLARKLIKEGDQKGFEKMLIATEKMMLERFNHGITDGDFAFDKNVGFLDDKAILLDFGSIIKKDVSDPEQRKDLILCVREEINRLQRLLSRRYPDAIVWLKEFFEENPEHLEFRNFLDQASLEYSAKSS